MRGDSLTQEKADVIAQAQELADEHLGGEYRTTKVLLWDDGDFRVDVIHGIDDYREKILWRSRETPFYPARTFVHIIDTIDCSEQGTIVSMEEL